MIYRLEWRYFQEPDGIKLGTNSESYPPLGLRIEELKNFCVHPSLIWSF